MAHGIVATNMPILHATITLLSVSYSLISFHFYLFYFPGAAAEPLGSARGALGANTEVGNLCVRG